LEKSFTSSTITANIPSLHPNCIAGFHKVTNLNDVIDPTLTDQAGQLRTLFDRAKPFRYLCIDGFFTDAAANQALADFPSFKAENAVNEFGVVGGKAVETKLRDISPFYKNLYERLCSRQFLDLMSDITGIPDLLPDPELFGGGTHENRNGQGLDPHVDFNRMRDLSAFRRLNLLVYLNPGWKAEWGGCIELHSDPRNPEADHVTALAPIFNRAVIFETSEISWHGFPKIRLPADQKHLSRKSISIYLYTKTRPAAEIAPPHATFYVQPPISEHLVAGHTLTASDVLEIKQALNRRDSWIHNYQKKELDLTDQIQRGRMFLAEVLQNLRAPIVGYGIQEGALTGLFHDRWVGPRLTLTIKPKRSVTGVTIHGWVPDRMPGGGTLTLLAGDQTEAIDLVAGNFALSVNMSQRAEELLTIEINATTWLEPKGTDRRTLVFTLQQIELGHGD
jgi:hypothetical protein